MKSVRAKPVHKTLRLAIDHEATQKYGRTMYKWVHIETITKEEQK